MVPGTISNYYKQYNGLENWRYTKISFIYWSEGSACSVIGGAGRTIMPHEFLQEEVWEVFFLPSSAQTSASAELSYLYFWDPPPTQHTTWYCQILQDTHGYCRILADTARYCRILPDTFRYYRILPDTVRFLGFHGFSWVSLKIGEGV